VDEKELLRRIAERTGASPKEVRAVVREFFPQAFSAALERGGTLVVPHFATFKCVPAPGAGIKFAFRPRTPRELIASARRRREKLARRRTSGARGAVRPVPPLRGDPYVPQPLAPPTGRAGRAARGREFNDPPRKRGFFARLFGWGE
jgi:hypothetical protein